MNPFNNILDWSFRGKYVRVYGTNRIYEGWVDGIHHKRSSVIVHDAIDVTDDEPRDLGSVYVRVVETVEVLSPSKTIELVSVSQLEPSPYHDGDFEVADDDMRAAYRDRFTGGFPVVRPIREDGTISHYELLNGHKRIEACRRVGLDAHPVEIVEASDEEARELFELAHRDQVAGDGGADGTAGENEGKSEDGADAEEPSDDADDEGTSAAGLEYAENT